MGIKLKILLLIFLNLLFVKNNLAHKNYDIKFNNAWVRYSEVMPTAAIYGVLENNSNSDIKLIKITSKEFKKVEIHQTFLKNNSFHMKQIKDFKIMAKNRIKLQPKKKHIMLMKKISNNIGDYITVDLNWLIMKDNTIVTSHYHIPIKNK